MTFATNLILARHPKLPTEMGETERTKPYDDPPSTLLNERVALQIRVSFGSPKKYGTSIQRSRKGHRHSSLSIDRGSKGLNNLLQLQRLAII